MTNHNIIKLLTYQNIMILSGIVMIGCSRGESLWRCGHIACYQPNINWTYFYIILAFIGLAISLSGLMLRPDAKSGEYSK